MYKASPALNMSSGFTNGVNMLIRLHSNRVSELQSLLLVLWFTYLVLLYISPILFRVALKGKQLQAH